MCTSEKMTSSHNGSSLLALPTCALTYRVSSGPQGLSIVIFHFDALMSHICGIISLSQVPKFGEYSEMHTKEQWRLFNNPKGLIWTTSFIFHSRKFPGYNLDAHYLQHYTKLYIYQVRSFTCWRQLHDTHQYSVFLPQGLSHARQALCASHPPHAPTPVCSFLTFNLCCAPCLVLCLTFFVHLAS